ncbi:2268_t:CDS:2, partial [Scutellospora calospora]
FSDIDDTNILSGDDVAKTFEQSQEKIVKIQEDTLLLFSFKTRAKGLFDLKATIKLINAIVGNWCSYTIKSDATRVEEAKLRCSESSSNEICEKSSCNSIVEKPVINLSQLLSLVSTQNQSNNSKQSLDMIYPPPAITIRNFERDA